MARQPADPVAWDHPGRRKLHKIVFVPKPVIRVVPFAISYAPAWDTSSNVQV
jgi:hypothetical protein